MEIHFTLAEIKEAAEKCWQLFPTEKVFAFHGEMGAGKTTFIQALCAAKGVQDTMSSPTFSIINEYQNEPAKNVFFHIDLYRLKDTAEVLQAGVEDCFYSGAFCFVEWPEKAATLLPKGTVHCYLTVLNSQTRHLLFAKK
ncbi:MAG: tRNA (adenosine(37)-N6)-threonylcarbamoyltransferase complex ATPase subunit type 1 TsaE [Chitinophagaceae bacterium]|nr:tRNA (adenosine(37)-N6)-threonylcarbamoyltransferase complex ATPase subunit type 1 TsaE [Chitinophagaceae bacterium]MCB0740844.1 tRNA (adenosine(37)-N6)-threonylcarbamoyltransferase complex ATPase subunit type 1 TsaE [Chitinophagaceae bacterium]HQU57119.1 tRNA (adenosine(37)-N6)-threonylcarbamoyltransferase complex ATPase subunit type 1 TsaE [Chitinophagaceae bacterium]HQV06455.1 tRNA (adenosine(37)-N6)-threonylcarbamoyltransferase complex ATPase subunit type 1 TsaE [Chitinophagaceae bacteriu